MSVRAGSAVALALAGLAGSALAQGRPTPDPAPAASPVSPSTAPSEQESGSDWEYEVEVTGATDYVFRGVDQTNRHLAGNLDVSAGYKSLYFGASTSNIDYRPFGDRTTDQELDGYVGYKDEAFGFGYDVGVVYYGYLHQPGGQDYVEAYGRGSREIGPLKLSAGLYVASESKRDGRGGVYGEVDAAYLIARKWTVSAGLGHGAQASDYLNWNLGVAYAVTRRVTVDLRYTDTDAHTLGRAYGDRVIAGVKVRFP